MRYYYKRYVQLCGCSLLMLLVLAMFELNQHEKRKLRKLELKNVYIIRASNQPPDVYYDLEMGTTERKTTSSDAISERKTTSLDATTEQRKTTSLNATTGRETTSLPHLTSSSQPNKTATPLLTLFTTFKNSSDRFIISMNVIYNWATMIPLVRPVLFTSFTDPRLVEKAILLGWQIHEAPRTNDLGTPYLKEMFQVVNQSYNSSFYGFCNGDILFDHGLIDTVKVLTNFVNNQTAGKLLVVGRRTNYNITQGEKLYIPADVTAVKVKGKLRRFKTYAQDYFLIAKNDYPWHEVPDIVIGRPGYDNYLVAFAISQGIQVVDASSTILALHQTGVDGNFAGYKNNDMEHNHRVIGKFNYSNGRTKAARLMTKKTENGTITVQIRKVRRKTAVIYAENHLTNNTTVTL